MSFIKGIYALPGFDNPQFYPVPRLYLTQKGLSRICKPIVGELPHHDIAVS
jgi:hypothetical protein